MLQKRFSEPSTYAGIGLLFTGINSILLGDVTTGAASIVTGLIAIFKGEGK